MLDVHLPLGYALSGCCACPALIDHQLCASPLPCCLCCIALFDGLFPVLASHSCQCVSPQGVLVLQWHRVGSMVVQQMVSTCSQSPGVAGSRVLCSQCSSALHWVVKCLWSSPFWSCIGLTPAFFSFLSLFCPSVLSV